MRTFWLALSLWGFLSCDALAGVNGVWLARYDGHEIAVEVQQDFTVSVYRVVLDAADVGSGRVSGMGGLHKVPFQVNGRKGLVTIKQGMFAPDVNLYIDGAEIPLTGAQ
ncbi:MAG: hypothetical protein HQL96_02715 [Magnetococcales bacterium]|nr:hypothetical protein [Magnetococcales bacterium]